MYRVMIVDDEEPVLESFSYLLKKGIPDFELCGMARSGVEAIELVPEAKPDLVFMDIQMPGMDGIEACRQIKQVEKVPCRVIVYTGKFEAIDATQARQNGTDDYCVKGRDPLYLLEAIKKLIG